MSHIELINLTYRYPKAGNNAVDSFSGVIHAGKITALLGSNGSGKSTIAKLAAGLIQPGSGKVRLNQASLTIGWNSIGYLFQYPDDQFVTASVESELAFGIENLALPSNKIAILVNEALDQFHLRSLKDRSPEQLSDGQKQLVALTSVMLMRPKFLILDEALSFLDIAWQHRIWQILMDISDKIGILWLTTHTQEALRADVLWLINDGIMIGCGDPKKILSDVDLEKYGLEPL